MMERERLQSGRTRRAGQTTAEFALVMVIFALFMLAIIDLSRAVYARNMVSSAAREGARHGSTHPADTAGITQAAKALLVGLDKNLVTVQAITNTTHIQVTVTYTWYPISLLIGRYMDGGTGVGLRLRGQARMRTAFD